MKLIRKSLALVSPGYRDALRRQRLIARLDAAIRDLGGDPTVDDDNWVQTWLDCQIETAKTVSVGEAMECNIIRTRSLRKAI